MPKRGSGVRPMLQFGAQLTAADFIGLFMINSDTILIGRFFGAAPLGLYTRAQVLLERPMQQILGPINAVLTPVLSRLQGDSHRYRRSFLRAYETLALITFSFAAICLPLAKPLVLVVLGPKWKDVAPLFSAFALVAISWPLSTVAIWLFQSQGRGREQLHNHALGGLVTIGSYFLGLYWGPIGVVVTLAIVSMAIRLPIVYYLAGRQGPVTTKDLWRAFFSHLPCWGTVYSATAIAHMLMKDKAAIVQLLVCGPIGLAVGSVVVLAFRRPRQSAAYAWNAFKNSVGQQWGGATARS